MIHRVLDLDRVGVREIMVPRNDIVSISVDAVLDEVLQTMIEQQHSRLPVYEGKPEQIVGILHYKDLLPVWAERKAAIRAGRPPRPFRVRQPDAQVPGGAGNQAAVPDARGVPARAAPTWPWWWTNSAPSSGC